MATGTRQGGFVRRIAVVVGVVLALLLAYATLDVVDVVPGVLTRAPLPTSAPSITPTTSATATAPVPRPAPAGMPLAGATGSAPQPTPAGLRAALASFLVDPRLGGSPGVAVRDALAGTHLLDQDPDTPRIPASTVKLLAAAAIDATFPAGSVLTTRAVRGTTPDRLVLLAGGDTLLAPGAGDATAVVGHAGLGDLAAATAAALRAQGTAAVTLSVDLSYAPGPLVAPTWSPSYRPTGITGAVTMLGLSSARALPALPGPADPVAVARSAFAAALRAGGIQVTVDPVATTTTPPGAPVYASVASAPVAEQIALALRESDNALTETLARQAAYRSGVAGGFAETAAWVRGTVAALGIDVTGVATVDASGLSRQDVVPTRVIADVLALGAGTKLPTLRETLRGLSIAGLDGSLAARFEDATTRAGAGVVRGKTGTLTGVSSLAGTLVTADGRLLVYAVIANGIPPTGAGTLAAREALDELVTRLAGCGCQA
ncbi:MAG: D-alanyl-D-alanine carboxypeptidase/D-alanyl-D-alanine-endopeptidase [Lapillicoccus sp.]